MKITAQVMVANEQNWVWYAIRSLIDHVDEIMVWDTGSEDETINTIKTINSPKLKLKIMDKVTKDSHTKLRQKMLDETSGDWFIILDGDEVWWQNSASTLIKSIKLHPDKSAIISPFINAVGDVFHYQDPKSGHYRIGDFQGCYTLRAINRKLPGLSIHNPHGRQEYRLGDGRSLQSLGSDLLFVDAPFLHLTHLQRSPQDKSTLKRSFKYRYELGDLFQTSLPEVFYIPRPKKIPSPWTHRSIFYETIALFVTPVRTAKRLLVPRTDGY